MSATASPAQSFENQLELPVVEIVDGQTVNFPRHTMDDLIRWANEEKQARIRRNELVYRNQAQKDAAGAPLTPLTEEAIQRLLQPLRDQGFEFGNLLAKVYEPEGTRKVLVHSLKKSGKTDEQALAILKKIHFKRQLAIAQLLMDPPAPPATPPSQAKKEGDEVFTQAATGGSPSHSSENTADANLSA